MINIGSRSLRLALVGPNFFSYIDGIQRSLADRGLIVDKYDERHANSVIVKALYRLGFYKIYHRPRRIHLQRLAQSIINSGATDVLLINIEVPDRHFVQELRNASLRVHVYMWDSTHNKPGFVDYLPLLHGKGSFDPDDCERLGLRYISLFAEDVFSQRQQGYFAAPAKVDIGFCGTLHSNRAKVLGQLEYMAKRRGLTVRLLLYFHSRYLLALKSLLAISNARFLLRCSSTSYSKRQIFDLFRQSRYVFDLPHPGQSGLTARTFEVLRAGSRLITFNNAAHRLLPPSLQSRVIQIKSTKDILDLEFSKNEMLPILSKDEDYALSLDRFIDDILTLMNFPKRIDKANGL